MLSCVLNHIWYDLGLSRSIVPKASQTPKKEHFWMHSDIYICVWALAHLLSEVTYSFLCIRRTNNFYRPLCWAQGVQGSFSCRIQKVNLDNWGRAVKTTAKASSGITTWSLDKPKFLSPWSEARKRLSLLLWKLQKVESMYKVLPIIAFITYYCI